MAPVGDRCDRGTMLHKSTGCLEAAKNDAIWPNVAFQIAMAGAVVLVAHTVLVAVGVGELATLVANVAFASALFVVARRGGLTRDELGVAVRPRGLSVAAVTSLVVVVLVLAVARLGLLPGDPALAGLPVADAWFRVLVAIPIGTALCEELIFRGVLLAASDRLLSRRWSTVAVSVMFGL
jgi:membrane protease YdiL (CAAX protease family)